MMWYRLTFFLISDETGQTGVGHAEECVKFDNVQVQCTTGVCRNISEVYKCEYKVSLSTLLFYKVYGY